MKVLCFGRRLELGGNIMILILDCVKFEVFSRDSRCGVGSWMYVLEVERFLDRRYKFGSYFFLRR